MNTNDGAAFNVTDAYAPPSSPLVEADPLFSRSRSNAKATPDQVS